MNQMFFCANYQNEPKEWSVSNDPNDVFDYLNILDNLDN